MMEASKTNKRKIVWPSVLYHIYLHTSAVIGLYYVTQAKWQTLLYTYFLVFFCTQGTATGVHRMWAHRSYKATLPLRIFLAFFHTMSFQKTIYSWARDHRIHHKFTDTECDPHNARKGFFYSQVGWLFYEKEDCVLQKGKTLDLTDLNSDPVVAFQKKYYWYLSPFIAFILPTLVPIYFWGETLASSWFVSTMLRTFINLHIVGFVNSLAHMFGKRPYDKSMMAADNLLATIVTHGEGYHNYHHAFPWDYKAGELGKFYGNVNTKFVDFMASIGWAYDLKSASPEMVKKRALKTGDGSWVLKEQRAWGWGDKDLDVVDLKMAKIAFQEG